MVHQVLDVKLIYVSNFYFYFHLGYAKNFSFLSANIGNLFQLVEVYHSLNSLNFFFPSMTNIFHQTSFKAFLGY